MKSLNHNQSGSGLVVVALLVLVIGLAGFAGYRVAHKDKSASNKDASVSQQTQPPAKIQSSADLKKANKALDSTAIDSTVNPGQLDNDVNSLL